jgi:exonuclease VII small subunit
MAELEKRLKELKEFATPLEEQQYPLSRSLRAPRD